MNPHPKHWTEAIGIELQIQQNSQTQAGTKNLLLLVVRSNQLSYEASTVRTKNMF
jgi:hypothetical protein